MGKIFNILESLNLASKDTKEIFSESTRDIENLQVFKDAISEIIYIDDFYIGDHVYNEGLYREEQTTASSASGYSNISIHGTKRYSIANHIKWAKDGLPGGHNGQLGKMETPELINAYLQALDRIDVTDTLIAIAEK